MSIGTISAGCLHDHQSTSPAPAESALTFDGELALEYVRQFATYNDGSPRFRIPGTVGQTEGAAFLWNATDLPGWQRTWQNFTGDDYRDLAKGTVEPYTRVGSSGCTQEDYDAVAGLLFYNLLAVKHATNPAAPLLLLGAHWDSQMHSDYDPDSAKRDLPDPGANDGASGVGLLLQMMGELDAQLPDLDYSVGMFFIDGEDGFSDCYPLAGSLYFAQHQPFHVAAFILLDMVGDPGAIYPKESYSRQSAPQLQDLLWRHGQGLAPDHFVNRTVAIEDDHVAMIAGGIPSVDIIDAGRPSVFPPQWDTTNDTVDKLGPEMLALVGQTLLGFMSEDQLSLLLNDGG